MPVDLDDSIFQKKFGKNKRQAGGSLPNSWREVILMRF